MSLKLDNFVIRMIQLTESNEIISEVINDQVKGFTSSNSAPVLGEDNMKYKIMFSNLEISNKSKFVIFQLSVKVNNEYFNPYLFHPIKNENNTGFIDGPGRAISYRLFDNKFDFVWIYLTIESVQRIIQEFSPTKCMTESNEYIKEYLPNAIEN